MDKTVLVICDKIQEIKRLRRYFDSGYIVRATNSSDNAAEIIETYEIDLILYDIGNDYHKMFRFYKKLRSDERTRELPLIIVAGIDAIKTLNNTVTLQNSTVISSTITTENMQNLIASYFPSEGGVDDSVDDNVIDGAE